VCFDATRPLLSRSAFMGTLAATAIPFASPSFALADATDVALPAPPTSMSAGNAQAARIAAKSPFVKANYAALHALVMSIADDRLRANVLELLRDPAPRYAAKWFPGMRSRELVDAMTSEGFVAAGTPVQTIFPATGAAQPFWSAPGSGNNSHHAYPGGLLAHELFNSSIGVQYARTYDGIYFADRKAVDTDVTIAAAVYHDVMKTVVFQWNADGTLAAEGMIGNTGAHHVLSGAEAIVRGCEPRVVIALLSAHAAPSLGDEPKVVTWCRAAAMLAQVDPVRYGLVRKTADGYALAPHYVPMEAFISHLSDHDYVLSIPAYQAVAAQLDRLAPNYSPGNRAVYFPTSAWFRNSVLATTSAIALYEILVAKGEDDFNRAVEMTLVSID
jgi:hypothetical protein